MVCHHTHTHTLWSHSHTLTLSPSQPHTHHQTRSLLPQHKHTQNARARPPPPRALPRYNMLKDMVVFFLLLFSGVGIRSFSLDSNKLLEQNTALEDLLIDEEWGPNYKKNWHEIMTQGEVWSWLNGPLLNGLYPTTFHYTDDPLNANQTGIILNHNRLVGGVQMRQVRYNPKGCENRRLVLEARYNKTYASTDDSCYLPWMATGESSNRGGQPFVGANGTVYEYETRSDPSSPRFDMASSMKGRKGYFDEGSIFEGGLTSQRDFGKDGWFAHLGTTQASASQALKSLEKNRWCV